MAMNFTDIKNDLFRKYSINPDNIKVSGFCREDEKKSLIYYLISCYELARKNLLKGNLTASSYACAVVLNDNSVHFGVNYNGTRNEISSICAERLALLAAFNSKVNEFEPEKNLKFDYEINYILMSSFVEENKIWTDKITPCADCLSWFNTGANLSADTKICSLRKDDKGEIYLDITPLNKYLPLRNLSYNTLDEISSDTKIVRSEIAKNQSVSDKELIKLYNLVLNVYKKNNSAKTSGQNVASGAIINGEIFTGQKVDFSKRWFIEPLMAACYKGIEKYGDSAKISTVCFIGEEYTTTESELKVKDGIISLRTLGRLNTKYANNNTIVLTAQNGFLQAQTIQDYMPQEHKFIHTYEIK